MRIIPTRVHTGKGTGAGDPEGDWESDSLTDGASSVEGGEIMSGGAPSGATAETPCTKNPITIKKRMRDGTILLVMIDHFYLCHHQIFRYNGDPGGDKSRE